MGNRKTQIDRHRAAWVYRAVTVGLVLAMSSLVSAAPIALAPGDPQRGAIMDVLRRDVRTSGQFMVEFIRADQREDSGLAYVEVRPARAGGIHAFRGWAVLDYSKSAGWQLTLAVNLEAASPCRRIEDAHATALDLALRWEAGSGLFSSTFFDRQLRAAEGARQGTSCAGKTVTIGA